MEIKTVNVNDEQEYKQWEQRHENHKDLVYYWSLLDDYKKNSYNHTQYDAYIFEYDDGKEKHESVELTIYLPVFEYEYTVYGSDLDEAYKKMNAIVTHLKNKWSDILEVLNQRKG